MDRRIQQLPKEIPSDPNVKEMSRGSKPSVLIKGHEQSVETKKWFIDWVNLIKLVMKQPGTQLVEVILVLLIERSPIKTMGIFSVTSVHKEELLFLQMAMFNQFKFVTAAWIDHTFLRCLRDSIVAVKEDFEKERVFFGRANIKFFNKVKQKIVMAIWKISNIEADAFVGGWIMYLLWLSRVTNVTLNRVYQMKQKEKKGSTSQATHSTGVLAASTVLDIVKPPLYMRCISFRHSVKELSGIGRVNSISLPIFRLQVGSQTCSWLN
ncbi:unnamed protein product [Fraxinus pennsylvanica]|uniref:Uncharacterized protein n=1 Tax=Fraxinus pennsylvanica TaxID=56036 RepID=A0AAD1Z5R0_9LAMI|nr:unnamed protein product [Fraxinus pennsylvanica]